MNTLQRFTNTNSKCNSFINKPLDPFFSIIIPTHNSGDTIAETLYSLKIQSFRNFEVLFVDYLSQDNTLELINAFISNNSNLNIFIINYTEKGIYEAMNHGLSKIQGKFVYFLGSDDKFYDNHVLSTAYNIICHENNKYDIYCGSVIRFNINNFNIQSYLYPLSLGSIRLLNIALLYFKIGVCHQGVFASAFSVKQGFSTKYSIASDFDWLITQVFRGAKIKRIKLIVAYYNTTGYSSNTTLLFKELCDIYYIHYGKLLGRLFEVTRKKRWLHEK